MYSSKSRITVTEKGLELQKEINDLIYGPQMSPIKKKSPSMSPPKSPRELDSMMMMQGESIQQTYPTDPNDPNLHLTIHEAIKRDLSYLDELGTEGTRRQSKLEGTQQYQSPEVNENKYLKKRVDKMFKDLSKDLGLKEAITANSLQMLSPNSNQNTLSQQNSLRLLASTRNHSLAQSHLGGGGGGVATGLGGRSSDNTRFLNQTDKFAPQSYNRILHIEQTTKKMIERHAESQKKILDTANLVLNKYSEKQKKLTDANHEAPEFLENIRNDHSDALEIIARKTNSEFRKKKRIAQGWRRKYEDNWQQYDDYYNGKAAVKMAKARQDNDQKGKKRKDYYDYLITVTQPNYELQNKITSKTTTARQSSTITKQQFESQMDFYMHSQHSQV